MFEGDANKVMKDKMVDPLSHFDGPSNFDNFLKGTEYDIFGQADRP